MSMGGLLQSLLNGLTLGGIYILVALGLTLVLSIMGIVQISHGEIYMVGAYLVYYMVAKLGLEFLRVHSRRHLPRRLSRHLPRTRLFPTGSGAILTDR